MVAKTAKTPVYRTPVSSYPGFETQKLRCGKTLRASAPSEEDLLQLLEVLKRSLPTAMIFLKSLSSMDVAHDGRHVLRLNRVVDKDSLIVSDGANDCIWHLLGGEFNDLAADLRRRHGNRIEAKSSCRGDPGNPRRANG